MTDYERIEKIIRYVTEQYQEQPTLEELASLSGWSVSRFHRIFREWAGVTPKQFLKYLTAEEARLRLLASASVLDASIEVGLSGPGRLHDLFVTLESATPGEIKSKGAGMVIEWGVAESPFGPCSLGWTQRGLCHLAFRGEEAIDSIPTELLHDWENARFVRVNEEAMQRSRCIFSEDGESVQPLRLCVRATEFQLKVWKALLRIPEGRVCSYSQVAAAVGNPRASRAVGAACGANRVGYLIPCHRVIRETGIVDGYRWGTLRKKAMLAREAAKAHG
ncbi:MAG: methylated-DNA--[protein]-cysteine S-methyltransferase [Verrucomicrobiota bacterium]